MSFGIRRYFRIIWVWAGRAEAGWLLLMKCVSLHVCVEGDGATRCERESIKRSEGEAHSNCCTSRTFLFFWLWIFNIPPTSPLLLDIFYFFWFKFFFLGIFFFFKCFCFSWFLGWPFTSRVVAFVCVLGSLVLLWLQLFELLLILLFCCPMTAENWKEAPPHKYSGAKMKLYF